MKIALIIAAVVVAFIAIVVAIGASLPKNHVVSRSALLPRDRQSVYATVRDVASAPRWRADVQKMEILDATHFREHAKHGVVTYEIVEDDPARKLVTRIADKDLGYSGSWTYTFEDAPGGSKITITENGEVSNVIFRFMSRFVFGHTATIDGYLRSLDVRLRHSG